MVKDHNVWVRGTSYRRQMGMLSLLGVGTVTAQTPPQDTCAPCQRQLSPWHDWTMQTVSVQTAAVPVSAKPMLIVIPAQMLWSQKVFRWHVTKVSHLSHQLSSGEQAYNQLWRPCCVYFLSSSLETLSHNFAPKKCKTFWSSQCP